MNLESGSGTGREDAWQGQLFEASQAATLIIDPGDGRIVDANPAACRYYGRARAALLNLRLADLERHAPPSAGAATEPLSPGSARHRLASGEIREVEIYSGLINRAGQVLLYAIVHDVTVRRQAEEAIHLLQATLDHAAEGIYILNREARIVYVNAAGCAALGYSRAELQALAVHDIDPDFPVPVWRAYWESLRQRGSLTFSSRHQRHDGSIFPVEIHANYLRFNGHEYSCAFVRDITARLQSEAALSENEERLRLALQASGQGLYDLDLVSGEITVNTQYARMLGYDHQEFRETIAQAAERLHPEDRQRVTQAFQDYLEGRLAEYRQEFRQQTRDGNWRWILSVGNIVARDAEGKPLRMLGTRTDITERKEAELALGRAREQLQLALDASAVGLWDWDVPGNKVAVNESWARIIGRTLDELGPADAGLLRRFCHPDDLPRALQAMERHVAGDTDAYRCELRLGHRSGRWIWVLQQGRVVQRDAEGRPLRMAGTLQDITERKQQEQRLSDLAHFDPLTNLPNRILLADRLDQALERSRRSGFALAVCLIDLDGFKEVNDVYGHNAGDRLLIEVAERLRECIRGEDTAARLGGDEFVLLLCGLHEARESEQILARVLTTIAAPFSIVPGRSVTISASIGVTVFPDDRAEADLLLRHADLSMYRAKQLGKNRYCFFAPGYAPRQQDNVEVMRRIANALSGNEFMLYFQPKVDCRKGRVVGVEALIRWQNPVLGLLSPAEFLPLIDDAELALEVGEWVLRETLRQIREWQRSGLDLAVSVNLFPRQVQQREFAALVKRLLDEVPEVPGSRLEIEVAESVAFQDVAAAGRLIEECRRLGVPCTLTNFGTGHTALTMLRRLPARTLKIDRSLVRDMLHDVDDLNVIEGAIGLASAFDREVVALGVESVEQMLLLLELGCAVMQGNALAPPMPAVACVDWLRAFRPDPLWSSEQSALVPEEDFQLLQAEVRHRQWLERLFEWVAEAPPGGDRLPPVETHDCDFGHWYYGEGRDRYRHLAEYAGVEPLHDQIHNLGRALIEAGQREGCGDVVEIKSELLLVRDALLHELRRLKLAVIREARGGPGASLAADAVGA